MLTSCKAGCLISSMKLQHWVLLADSGLAYLLSTFTSPPINSGMRILIKATANALWTHKYIALDHPHNIVIIHSTHVILSSGAVLVQKFWGRGAIAPSVPSSPSPFYLFSKTEKYKLHIGIHLKSIETATFQIDWVKMSMTKHWMDPCMCGTILNNKMKICVKVEILAF